MRILLLAPHPFYVDRGTPIDVDILLRALSARGETVDVVTYGGGEDRVYPGVTLYRAPTPSWLGAIGPGFSLKKVIADCWLFAKARRLVATHKYDVIHANEEAVFLAVWFKFRNGLQYVYDMDSSIAQQLVEKRAFLKPAAFFFNWCEAKAIRSSLAVAPVCNALAELARNRGAHHITTLHDISQLTAADFLSHRSLREELGLRGIVLMYVGNLEPYQGVDLLLESLVHVILYKDCDLVVAGGTPESIRTYREKARRLGIDRQTHLIGPWPAKRLGELLSQADILVAPRIRGINTPMKVFPYMHSGRAVLVTALPTHTQILNNSVCEMAPADPRSFAKAIIRLAGDEERRHKVGAAGRQFVQAHHTFPAHQQRVDELYSYVEAELNLMASPPARIAQQTEHGLNKPLQTKHKETLA